MILDFWTRIAGAAKERPETRATVRSVHQYEELARNGRYLHQQKLADVTFDYTDQQQHQYGSITVRDTSELYDAEENDAFMIRVDPKQGEKYYSAEATEL